MNDLAMDKTGYVPSRDERNWQLETAQAPAVLPPDFFVAPIDGLPIFMQSKQPSCVAHSVSWTIMQKILKQTGKLVILSPRFLYALSKQTDGIPGEGTTLVNALRMAQKYGVCEDKYFPNDVSLDPNVYKDASKIPPEAFENAKLHKIDSYYFLNDLSYGGLKNGIFQNDLLMIGMDVNQNWWTDVNGNSTWEADAILPLRPPHPATSRHCVALYAYNHPNTNTALMNWWSDKWGLNGTGFFGSNELPYIYEAAVLFLPQAPLVTPAEPEAPKVEAQPFWKVLLESFKQFVYGYKQA